MLLRKYVNSSKFLVHLLIRARVTTMNHCFHVFIVFNTAQDCSKVTGNNTTTSIYLRREPGNQMSFSTYQRARSDKSVHTVEATEQFKIFSISYY